MVVKHDSCQECRINAMSVHHIVIINQTMSEGFEKEFAVIVKRL